MQPENHKVSFMYIRSTTSQSKRKFEKENLKQTFTGKQVFTLVRPRDPPQKQEKKKKPPHSNLIPNNIYTNKNSIAQIHCRVNNHGEPPPPPLGI